MLDASSTPSTQARKPFFAYAALTQPHLPTLPNPAFAGKTGNGDWADMLAEMDHNVGDMLDAVDRLGIRDNTIVIFASDNGPEFIKPWDGWAGPWRGQYFTACEGGIRVPFLIRWPGKVPAGGEVAQFQGALLSTGDDGFAADQAGNPASIQSLYEPARGRGQGDHRQLDLRAGAENDRRIRREREKESFDRNGNARSLHAATVMTDIIGLRSGAK
jgi:Sulfatase